ncbi:NADH-quinone oxidoreductase subunit NuoN [Moraxella boevrei]|uniref:NADH-quinone oxidoreductase subunit NuoN n=1 Tax=Faucicola boevrei TaxID=346665 RepID=UPI0037369DDD
MNSVIFDSQTLMALAPMLILGLTVVVVMIAIAVKRSNMVAGTLSVIGLNVAMLTLIAQLLGYLPSSEAVSTLFMLDGFAKFNMLMVLLSALACFTLAYGYIEGYTDSKEELYLLMLIATLGGMFMVASDHLASFFISLELLSIPMYGMLAYTFNRSKSLEAGLKYLVLSATASATMLMGMALIYAYTGTLSFRQIGIGLFGLLQSGESPALLVVGASMVLFGIAFKLSAVPFHTWTPDVYQGAPAPVATFLGSVAKVAMLALAVRFLATTASALTPAIVSVLFVIAILSMIIGNLLALRQTNVKRMLSYSSIAHLGYVLAIIASMKEQSGGLASLYMAVYALTTVGAFGVITIMSSPYQNHGEAEHIENYRGMFWQRPILTAVMTVMLLSLAGVPLTAGFISKFFAVFATVQVQQWWLAGAIIVGSAISLYYYLHFMLIMFKRPQQQKSFDAVNHWGIQAGGIMVLLVTALILFLGIFPSSLYKIVEFAYIAPMQ